MNALTLAIYDDLGRAFHAIKDDDEIRAVVLTGAGDAPSASVLTSPSLFLHLRRTRSTSRPGIRRTSSFRIL